MKTFTAITTLLASIIGFQIASAHEQRVLDLNGTLYYFVVGSLNEPVVVDDRTGLDLQVHKIGTRAKYEALVKAGDIPEKNTPVIGLEETLKAEIFVGAQVQPMELSKLWGEAGKYKTLFYPTSVATIGYRIYGTVDSVAFDQTFVCNPAGHVMKPAETTHTMEDGTVMEGHTMPSSGSALSENVIFSDGSFGCPKAKSDYGFPGKAEEHDDDNTQQMITLVLAALAFGISLSMLMRHRMNHAHHSNK